MRIDPDPLRRSSYAKRTTPRSWTPEEDAIINEHYTRIGAHNVRKRIPHRSLSAIQQRACALKVTRRHNR